MKNFHTNFGTVDFGTVKIEIELQYNNAVAILVDI